VKELEKAFAVSMNKGKCPTSLAVFAASSKKGRSHLRHTDRSPICLTGAVSGEQHRKMSQGLWKRQIRGMSWD